MSRVLDFQAVLVLFGSKTWLIIYTCAGSHLAKSAFWNLLRPSGQPLRPPAQAVCSERLCLAQRPAAQQMRNKLRKGCALNTPKTTEPLLCVSEFSGM